jgi:sensor histidine kinase YesM
MPLPTLRLWFAAALVFAAGTLVGAWVAGLGEPPPSVGPTFPRMAPSPVDAVAVLRTVGVGSFTWYACVVSAPLLLWLARRVPIGAGRGARAVVLHLTVVLGLVVATSVAQHWLTYRAAPGRPPLTTFLSVAALMNVVPLLTVAALVHALESWRRARGRERDAARLGMQLAQARFDALAAQLQPHFLFNALQGISTLIHRDPAAADAMLGRLGELLRDVLRHDPRQEIPLREELDVLDRYLDLSRQRLGDRLNIDIDVSAEARDGLVPFFLLQPIVENAVEHGVASRAAGGRVGIRAAHVGDALRLEVRDDGPGLGAPGPRRPGAGSGVRNGVGLANTRERLRELYGGAHMFELTSPEDGGVRVVIELPFRRAQEPAGT